jgi:predicted polyphosphate/ATP-dependent NAD kinase
MLTWTVAEKVPLIVIPNGVRNLSGFENQKKERFLGTQRASE